jgi:hypothetical protein
MRKFYREAVSEDTEIILITSWRQRTAGKNILNVYLQYNYWTIEITKSITFGVVTAVKIHSTPFWVMTPCSLVDWCQGLLGMYCLVRVQCVPPSVVTTNTATVYTDDYSTHSGDLWCGFLIHIQMYVCPLRVRVEVLAYTWPLRKLTGYPLPSDNNQ